MSDTPRTYADLAAYGIPSGGNDPTKQAGEYVRRKLAESLELELTAALRERDELKDRLDYFELQLNKALRGHQEAWNAALDAALQQVPGGSICDPQDVADAIRALRRPEWATPEPPPPPLSR